MAADIEVRRLASVLGDLIKVMDRQNQILAKIDEKLAVLVNK